MSWTQIATRLPEASDYVPVSRYDEFGLVIDTPAIEVQYVDGARELVDELADLSDVVAFATPLEDFELPVVDGWAIVEADRTVVSYQGTEALADSYIGIHSTVENPLSKVYVRELEA